MQGPRFPSRDTCAIVPQDTPAEDTTVAHRKGLSAEELERVRALTRAGDSARVIAVKTGISEHIIGRHWRIAGGREQFADTTAESQAQQSPRQPVLSAVQLRALAQDCRRAGFEGVVNRFCAETGKKRADVVRFLLDRYPMPSGMNVHRRFAWLGSRLAEDASLK